MTETLKIDGMTCNGCVSSVQNALSRLPLNGSKVGIGTAEIDYDEKMVNQQQIVDAIEDAGFTVLTTGNFTISESDS